MAISKCPGCGYSSFELKVIEPSGSKYKIDLIQCSSCGVAVGAVEYLNAGALLEGVQQQLTGLERRVQNIESAVSQIVDALRRL